MKNFFTGLVMLLGAIVINLNMGTKLRTTIIGKGLSEIFWPQTLLIILMIMSIALMATDLRNMEALKAELKKFSLGNVFNRGATRLVLACVSCFVYVQALSYLGFMIATPIFLSVMLFFIGFRGFLKLVPAALVITAICMYCFSSLGQLPLPTGSGVFREFNLFFT